MAANLCYAVAEESLSDERRIKMASTNWMKFIQSLRNVIQYKIFQWTRKAEDEEKKHCMWGMCI